MNTQKPKFRGKPWPTKRLTLEEQIKILGIHWRGHENYQPTPAHLYWGGSYILDKWKEKRILEKYGYTATQAQEMRNC